MRGTKLRKRILAALAVAGAILSGCGLLSRLGPPEGGIEDGSLVPVKVRADLGPGGLEAIIPPPGIWPGSSGPIGTGRRAFVIPALATIRLTVEGPGIATPIVKEVPAGTAEVTVQVPAGSDRKFELMYLSAAGELLAEGSTIVAVAGGGEVVINIVTGLPDVTYSTPSYSPEATFSPCSADTASFQFSVTSDSDITITIQDHDFTIIDDTTGGDVSGTFSFSPFSPNSVAPFSSALFSRSIASTVSTPCARTFTVRSRIKGVEAGLTFFAKLRNTTINMP